MYYCKKNAEMSKGIIWYFSSVASYGFHFLHITITWGYNKIIQYLDKQAKDPEGELDRIETANER